MRKFHPYAVAAKARGIKVYHLNIGQPDVQTPPAFLKPSASSSSPCSNTLPPPVSPS